MSGHNQSQQNTAPPADEAMYQIWRDWLNFYQSHFRAPGANISAADQMAFYEIAQPILRALSAPAASTGEPVAWLIEWLNDGTKSVSLSECTNPSPHKSTPLYAAPASGDVRAAVIEAFRDADDKDWVHLSFLLGYGAHGHFWRLIFQKVRDALSQAPATDAAGGQS